MIAFIASPTRGPRADGEQRAAAGTQHHIGLPGPPTPPSPPAQPRWVLGMGTSSGPKAGPAGPLTAGV